MPVIGKKFFSSLQHPDQFQGPTQPSVQRGPGNLSLQCEAEHSCPSSAKVKNEYSYTCTPSCMHGTHKDFTLSYLLPLRVHSILMVTAALD